MQQIPIGHFSSSHSARIKWQHLHNVLENLLGKMRIFCSVCTVQCVRVHPGHSLFWKHSPCSSGRAMSHCLCVSPVPNWNPIREPPSEETMLRLNNLFQRDILWKEQRWWGTHGVDSSEQKLFLQISAEIFSGFLQKSVLDFSRNLFLISPEIFSRFLEKSVLDFSRNLFLVSANICLCSDERVLSAVHSLASYNTAFWPLFCIEHLHHIYEAGRGLRSWQWGVLSTYVWNNVWL